jgi:hypothetical protein
MAELIKLQNDTIKIDPIEEPTNVTAFSQTANTPLGGPSAFHYQQAFDPNQPQIESVNQAYQMSMAKAVGAPLTYETQPHQTNYLELIGMCLTLVAIYHFLNKGKI